MAVFTAIATAIGTAIGLTGAALTIFTAVTTFALAVTTSRLIAKRALRGIDQGAGGGRVQLPPATDNKLPVVYGSAFISGPVIDAKISLDQQTMWYVVALAEHTDSTPGSGYTFDTNNVYYNGKKVQFGANGVVTGLINTSVTPNEIDDKMSGKINIWLFPNGSSSGINTGGQTAIQILQDITISFNNRWTASDTMTNCAFAVIRVKYDTDAGTTSLGALQCKITNSLNKPGDAIKDYLLNTRYGCAVPLSRIDTDSLDALNAYSDETIEYKPVGWTEGAPLVTQPRYRINGPLDTFDTCLENLQILADSCDSWLQYNELNSKWSVVINRSYEDFTTIDNLFLVDDNNLVGGIDITPINLSDTFNELEVSYPNSNIKDQTDFRVVKLSDFQVGVLSPNEAVNRLNLSLPVVNEPVQAQYIGVRRLLQSREDLTVNMRLDYSGIQIQAGDVIRVKHNEYLWDQLNNGRGKLFRVLNVTEQKQPDGNLGVVVAAFEYNDTIYEDFALQDFELADNIGVTDPNIIGKPFAPTVQLITNDTINKMRVTGSVPTQGLVRALDFYYGNTSNADQHVYFSSITNSTGVPLNANESFTINVVEIDEPDTIFWSVKARNPAAAVRSDASSPVNWPGSGVSQVVSFNACNAFSVGNVITSDAIANLAVGGLVVIESGDGELAPNTRVDVVNSATEFVVTETPITPLSNACIRIDSGGISSDNFAGEIPASVIEGLDQVINDALLELDQDLDELANAIANNTSEIDNLNSNVLPNLENTLNAELGNLSNSLSNLSSDLGNNTVIINDLTNNTIPNLNSDLSNNTVILANLTNNTIPNLNSDLSNNSNAINDLTNNVLPNLNAELGNLETDLGVLEGLFPITSNSIANFAVIANKIGNLAVDGTKIANGAVGEVKIANGAVGTAKIANGAVGEVKIANGAVTGTKIGNQAITEVKIANGAVTANILAANAVISEKILANAIIAGKIATNAVTAGTIAANAVTAGTIAANAVTATQIAANTITSNQIAANAITANEIAANAVTAVKINADAVTAVKIQANAVIADKIAANAVTAVKIQADAVTAAKIQANAVIANKIQAGAVTTEKMTANTINGDRITFNTMAGNKITVNTLNGDRIIANTILGNRIVANTISGDRITTNTITANKINVANLSSIQSQTGTLFVDRISTANSTTAQRLEITGSQVDSTYAVWSGPNAKTDANARFYIKQNGDAKFGGRIISSQLQGPFMDAVPFDLTSNVATDNPSTTANVVVGNRFLEFPATISRPRRPFVSLVVPMFAAPGQTSRGAWVIGQMQVQNSNGTWPSTWTTFVQQYTVDTTTVGSPAPISGGLPTFGNLGFRLRVLFRATAAGEVPRCNRYSGLFFALPATTGFNVLVADTEAPAAGGTSPGNITFLNPPDFGEGWAIP